MIKFKKYNNIDSILNFSFKKSEFFFLNSLQKKFLVRQKLEFISFLDTFSTISLVSSTSEIKTSVGYRFFLGASFIGEYALLQKKQIKFLDLIPKLFFFNPFNFSMEKFFRGLTAISFKSCVPVLRIFGGYFIRVHGFLGFISYKVFIIAQKNLKIELSLIPFNFLPLHRKRKLRRNRLKYIKMFSRFRNVLPVYDSPLLLLFSDLGLQEFGRLKLKQGFFLSDEDEDFSVNKVDNINNKVFGFDLVF